MDDRAFEILEKLYSEFTSFKEDISKKVDKNTLLLEQMNDKIKILAEVQQNHLEINERQHEDMNETNKDQLELLKSALQHISHNA